MLIKRSIFDALLFAYFGLVVLAGVFQPSFEQLEDLKTNSLIFLGLCVVGLILFLFLHSKKIKTLGSILFFKDSDKLLLGPPKSFFKTFWGWQILVLLVTTIIAGVVITNISIIELLSLDSILNARRLFLSIANPDWGLLPVAILKIIETIFIAFMATLLAVPIAFVLSFFSAKNIMDGNKTTFSIYLGLRTIFNISRSIEPILWAIIFSVWVGFGPFAGMLALMIHSIASLSKQYSEIVECISEGPLEGVQASGANFIQKIWYAVVPQIVLPYISFTIYRWDINVRMATIIGFVGGGGIGELLLQHQRLSNWPKVGCIIVVIAVVVWLMDNFSAYVREAIK